MSLSLSMTSRSVSITPALFMASNAMPADMAPSPMIATARRFSPVQLGRLRHAQRRRNRRAGMRRAEGVVFAFRAPRKAGDAAVHAQPGHALAPAGEDLVRVGLVAHVPDQPVVRRVEHVVQRDREFHRAEIGRQVAAGLAHRLDDEGAQLVGQLRQLAPFQGAQLGRAVDRFSAARTLSDRNSCLPCGSCACSLFTLNFAKKMSYLEAAHHDEVGQFVQARSRCAERRRAPHAPRHAVPRPAHAHAPAPVC